MTAFSVMATLPPELEVPQGEAYIAAMLFLGTAGVIGLAVLAALVTGLRGHLTAARWLAAAALTIAGVYAAAVLGAAALSRERTLPLGAEKHFCELDCHVAYSVTGVRRTATVGAPPVRAANEFRIVTVRVRFDERTISSHRGMSPLYPSRVRVRVVDAAGHPFAPSEGAQEAYDRAQGSAPSWSRPIRPGESFTKDVVFDLPRDLAARRFLIESPLLPSPFLVFNEESPGHAKTYLTLPD